MLRTIILFCLAAVSLCAQVAVTDTLKVAAGNQNFDGFVAITSPQMTYGGVTYLAGTKTVSVVNGAFTVNLWPNYGATPANTYYRVTYTPRMAGTAPIAPWTEMWEVIPANCTTTVLCTVAQVRKAGAVTNPAGSPLTNPMTTAGDMIYYGTALSRLPIGTPGQALTVVNGIPAWATPATTASAGEFGIGTLYAEAGQGGYGATYRALAVADGSASEPVTSTAPSLVVQRTDSSTSPIPFQFSLKKVGGGGYTYGLHSFARVTDPSAVDTVATTGSVYMEPSSAPSVNQTGWALWGRAERSVKASRLAGMEIDVINSTDASAPNSPAVASSSGNGSTLGLQLVSESATASAGNLRDNSLALHISANTYARWATGIMFDANSVRTIPIDIYPLGNNGYAPIRLANGTYIAARNAADTGEIPIIGTASDDSVRVTSDTGMHFYNVAQTSGYMAIAPTGVTISNGLALATAAEPTCGAATRGKIHYVAGGTGVADTLRVCRKDASNNYAWTALF